MNFKNITLAILFIIGCEKQNKVAPNLLDFVPQNTLAVFQINDQNMLKSSINNTSILKDIIKIKKTFYENLSQIIPENFPQKSLLFFTSEGKSEIAISFIYEEVTSDSISSVSRKGIIYNNIPIRIVNVENKKIYNASIDGVNFTSTSQLVIENGIRNIQNKRSRIQKKYFYDLAKISDENAPMNLLIHHDFSKTLELIFPQTPLFPFIGSSWFSFDFNTKKDPFTLDGVSFINDSLPDALSLLKGLDPKVLYSPNKTPQNFDSFLAFSINDYKALEENFKQYSRFKNIALNKINFSILSGVDEIAWIHLQKEKALLLHLSNSENIDSLLFSNTETVTSYREIPFFKQNLPEDFLSFVETYGEVILPNYVCKIGAFLIYTENQDFLKQIISASLDGNTLANDFNFKALEEDLADKSSFLWLGRTQNLKSNWNNILKETTKEWENINVKKYPLIAFQGVAETEFIQTRITVQNENPQLIKNSVINQFNFSLDATASRPPQWIKNHRNKTMDIVVQDQNNMLYLFSNTGILFWKKQLPGPIVGKIEQVDLYKNRRLQMAFRTPDLFMILDRNGRVVSPFNIKISNETPQQFSVFDYDLNRNYRFLLTHGKKIEMFNNKGKKISGFKLKSLDRPLKNPPKHVRYGTKDYIILQDIDGQIRLINRQGKDRIQLKNSANTSSNPVYGYRNTFATTNKEGDLIQIDSKGNVIVNELNLQPGHFIDMTSKSIVTLSENKLMIKGIPVELPFGNYTPPKIHYINNTIYITLTELETKKVYAFLSNGIPLGGFPVYGNSIVDLSNADNDKAIEMVVQSEGKGFIIYQIN